MASKAELQAELDILRTKMAELDHMNAAIKAAQEEAPQHEQPVMEPKNRGETDFSDAASELERILAPYGVSASEIEALAERFWKELDTFPQQKPLLTAIAAFALGFLLGRLTK